MQKRQLGQILAIVILASFCIGARKCKCKEENQHVQVQTPASTTVKTQTIAQKPVVLSENRQWVNKIVAEYPEIVWFASADVQKTEEGQGAVINPYSVQLYGQKFIEFDRSLMSLYCLKLILDGSEKSYLEFTAAQPANVKLSRESFMALHKQGMSLLNAKYKNMSPAEMQQTLETALILRDIGKSKKARDIFEQHGANAPDHHDFYGQVMLCLKNSPELSSSFSRLNSSAKTLLVKTANLVNYGYVTHLEGGPSLFTKLKQSAIQITDRTALSFDLFVHTCDVAGALGHVNNTSSIVYTEVTHRALQAMASACRVLSNPTKTEAEAYETYIAARASWLGFDPSDREGRILTRIAAMLRLFTPEEGAIVKNSILQLSPNDRERIVSQFDVREEGRTPTYMPTLLINLYNNKDLGATPSERLSKAVIRGVPFIAEVLEQHQQQLLKHQANPEIPLNFNSVAGIAKSKPDLLQKGKFQIGADGSVTLQ